MSFLLFQEEFKKFLNEIYVKQTQIKKINLKLKTYDDFSYNLNEVYNIYQRGSISSFTPIFSPKTIETMIKYVIKDLNTAKSLNPPSKFSNELKTFSLSAIIRKNHVDRLQILLSLSDIQAKIKNKRNILETLRKNNNSYNDISSRITHSKVSILSKELKIINESVSSTKKKVNEMMFSAQSLKSQTNLFHQNLDVIRTMKKSAEEDSKAIAQAIKMCLQKRMDVNCQINATNILFPSIRSMFDSSLDRVKNIHLILNDRWSSMDTCLDHVKSVHEMSKMYYIIFNLLDDFERNNYLILLRDKISSTNFDYKEESKNVLLYCDHIKKTIPSFNKKMDKELSETEYSEENALKIVRRIQDVFNEWTILQNILKV